MPVSLRRVALGIAALLAVTAPLPFGATTPGARAALALAIGVGLALVLLDLRRLPVPPARFALLAAATLALLALYFVPIPAGILERIEPRAVVEARKSLALAGEDPALAAAEARLLEAAGARRTTPAARPLALDAGGRLDGTTRVLLGLGAFLLALLSTGNEPGRRFLAGALAVSAFLQASYGLAEALSGHYHILWRARTSYLGLPSGTFVCPNHFAALLSLGLFATLALLAARRHRGEEETSFERGARLLLGATAAAVLVIAMTWSSSRAGLGAAGAGLLLWLVLGIRRLVASPRGRAALVLGVLVAGVLVAGSIWMRPPTPLREDLETVSLGWGGRTAMWRTGLRIEQDFRWFGVGPGCTRWVHPLYRPPEQSAHVSHLHNDWLEWKVETGWPGMLLLLGWVLAVAGGGVLLLRRARKGERALTLGLGCALVALAIHEFVDFSLQLPGVAVPAALAAGAFLAPLAWGPGRGSGPRARTAWKLALGLAAAAVLLAGLATHVAARPRLAADRIGVAALADPGALVAHAHRQVVLAVRQATREGAPPRDRLLQRAARALRLLRVAEVTAPLRPAVRRELWAAAQAWAHLRPPGTALPEGFVPLTRSWLHRAEELAPVDRANLLTLARTWLVLGDRREAYRLVREFLRLAPYRAAEAYDLLGEAASDLGTLMEATPNTPDAAYRLALWLRRRGDRSGARIVLERAVARHPDDPRLRSLLAATLMDQKRYGEALALLEGRPVPNDPGARLSWLRTLATLHAVTGNGTALEEDCRRLVAAGEDPRVVAIVRARFAIRQKRRDEAIRLLREALASPGPPLPRNRRLEALLVLGSALRAEGRNREALEAYREARKLAPDHPAVRSFFERLHRVAPERNRESR